MDFTMRYSQNQVTHENFGNRKAAVHFIEVVYNYPMLDIKNLVADKDYYARIQFGIDTDELQLSFKSDSLWDNGWNLQSDWYEWEVKRPES